MGKTENRISRSREEISERFFPGMILDNLVARLGEEGFSIIYYMGCMGSFTVESTSPWIDKQANTKSVEGIVKEFYKKRGFEISPSTSLSFLVEKDDERYQVQIFPHGEREQYIDVGKDSVGDIMKEFLSA